MWTLLEHKRRPRRDFVVHWMGTRQGGVAAQGQPAEQFLMRFVAILMRFPWPHGESSTAGRALCGIERPCTDDRVLFELACYQFSKMDTYLHAHHADICDEIESTTMDGLIDLFGSAIGCERAQELFIERTIGYTEIGFTFEKAWICSRADCLASAITTVLRDGKNAQELFAPFLRRLLAQGQRRRSDLGLCVDAWEIETMFLLEALTSEYAQIVHRLRDTGRGCCGDSEASGPQLGLCCD